jgi:hypothetical protein
LRAKGDHSFSLGRILQDRLGFRCPMPEKVCGGHDTYVHAGMFEEDGQGISPRVAMSAELVERSAILLGVLVPRLGISLPDGSGLGSDMGSELLDKLLQIHHQVPLLMF